MTTMLDYYKWKNSAIKNINMCNGGPALIDLAAASVVLTDQMYKQGMTDFMREEFTSTLPELGKIFDEKCVCKKISETKTNFELQDPRAKKKDEKVERLYWEAGKEIIKDNDECNCGSILYGLAPFVHISAIVGLYGGGFKPEKTITSLFLDWDKRCICHRKGIGTYSDSIGRYEK